MPKVQAEGRNVLKAEEKPQRAATTEGRSPLPCTPPGPRSPGLVSSVSSLSSRFSLRLVAWPEITPTMMIPSGASSIRDTLAMLTGCPFSRVQKLSDPVRRPTYRRTPGFAV